MIPSLSELGWVTDTRNMLAKIFSYYILTDAGQTIAFQNKVTSLPYTYHLYIHKPQEMAQQVEKDLQRLLERYFEISEVDVRVEESRDKLMTILIFAYVIDKQGVKMSMGKVLEMDTEGLRRTVDISNRGDGDIYFKTD